MGSRTSLHALHLDIFSFLLIPFANYSRSVAACTGSVDYTLAQSLSVQACDCVDSEDMLTVCRNESRAFGVCSFVGSRLELVSKWREADRRGRGGGMGGGLLQRRGMRRCNTLRMAAPGCFFKGGARDMMSRLAAG